MSDASTKQTVECPICEDEFDPTVAGGWCTNTECGEWQYTETDDEADSEDDGFVSPAEMDEDSEPDAAPEESDAAAAEDPEESVQSPSDIVEVDDEDEDAEAEPEAAIESEPEPEIEAEPDEVDVSEPEVEESADDDEPAEAEAESDAATIECHDCGAELDEGANFCVECGADVSEADESDELDACPSCEDDVKPEDSFCVNCGEDLDAHRESDAEEDHDDAIDALSDEDAVPEELVLEVEGREITVEDGEKVGREIRAALMDAGRPEEEAVRIHREHVRFVREEDSFYVLDLGDNPTALNGTSLTKGDREPIGPGDELELSGVTTVDVRAP